MVGRGIGKDQKEQCATTRHLWLMSHKHRQWRIHQNLSGKASKYELPNTAVSISAHNEKGGGFTGRIEERICRIALLRTKALRRDAQTVPGKITDQPVRLRRKTFFFDGHHDNFFGTRQEGHRRRNRTGRLWRRFPRDRHRTRFGICRRSASAGDQQGTPGI
jgi:hypothetical protein